MKRHIVKFNCIHDPYAPLSILLLSGTDLVSTAFSGSFVPFCQHKACANLLGLAINFLKCFFTFLHWQKGNAPLLSELVNKIGIYGAQRNHKIQCGRRGMGQILELP